MSLLNLDYGHSAVLVFVEGHVRDDVDQAIGAFTATLPFGLMNLVRGPFPAPHNGGATWMFAPDGSKRYGGWIERAAEIDEHRRRFVTLFEQFRHDDGSTPCEAVYVHFGPSDLNGERRAPVAWSVVQ